MQYGGGNMDFDVTHETSDSESTYSTSNSEDPIVESRDVNTVNTEISNTSIDDQLKMIREEKHQEYLQNTGWNSPSSEKPKITKTRQFNDLQARKENINETAETNEEFHWPSGTCAIVGDSMALMKRNYRNMAMLKLIFRVQELMIWITT